MGIDWDSALSRNRLGLAAIVAALIAMAGWAERPAPGAAMLPRPLRLLILRLLRPAESAVRRLILVAARGLTVEAPALKTPAGAPARAKPALAVWQGKTMPVGRIAALVAAGVASPYALPPRPPARAIAFPLFDPLKRFRPAASRAACCAPRVAFLHRPLMPLAPPASPDGPVGAHRLALRLAAIVAALIAMAGWAERPPPGAAMLPRPLRLLIPRLLRPAEFAVRRLILVAARGLTVEAPALKTPAGAPARAKPALAVWQGKAMPVGRIAALVAAGVASPYALPPRPPARAIAFPLFDPLKRFRPAASRAAGCAPRIAFLHRPLMPLAPPASPDGPVGAHRLALRLAATEAALGDLAGEARRLARLRASLAGPRPSRLAALAPQDEDREPAPDVAFSPHPEPPRSVAFSPHPEPPRGVAFSPHPEPPRSVAFSPHPETPRGVAFSPHPEPPRSGVSKGVGAVRSPRRPGRPPGWRRRSIHAVDHILAECDGLARDAERDTS